MLAQSQHGKIVQVGIEMNRICYISKLECVRFFLMDVETQVGSSSSLSTRTLRVRINND